MDNPLPNGVRVKGDTLLFQRPLSPEDEGVYVCRVSNSFATKEAQADIAIKGIALAKLGPDPKKWLFRGV